MPRPQFSLKTMLWLMAVVGAMLVGHRLLCDRLKPDPFYPVSRDKDIEWVLDRWDSWHRLGCGR